MQPSNTFRCVHCAAPLPAGKTRNARPKYCSTECHNAVRRAKYAENPRPRKRRPTVEERLWSRVEKMPSGCWEWQGYRMPFGYGQIGIEDHKVTTCHRVAWELTNGPIPDGLLVRHKCDNPPCCNPDHLELGDDFDNMRDAVERGRIAREFRLPVTVLSAEDVRDIRARYRKYTVPGQRGYRTTADQLAKEYGVSRQYIAAVAAGRERLHVTDA